MARPLEIGKAATRIRDGAPYSDAFDDIYYSRADGLDETRYVFLAGNDLAARLPRASRFCIGETGFGTGLNFLAAWQLWERLAPADASLEFISAEKFPLDPATIRDAMAVFPELAPYTAQLLEYYPPRIPGFHRLALADGRIRLTLLFGDAAEAFGKLEAGVDAWFLDGFAPARNTAMWSDDLFRQLARLSKRGTTLATFTAAGQVRRSLEAAGFSITKRAGYAGKREMITARLDSPGTYPSDAPWFDLPHTPPNTAVHAIVIGAGIAGCSVAHALGARGATVRLIERAPQIATAASGNPAGLLMPKLTADQSLSSRFYTEAYRHTLQLLQQLTARGHRPRWNACGVLQLGFHDKVQRSHARVAERALPEEFVRVVEADEATALAGVPLPLGGLWFPGGGWIDPRSFCQALLDDIPPGQCEVLTAREAITCQRDGDAWSIHDGADQKIARGSHLVVCTGADTARLLPALGDALTSVRGQITHIPMSSETTDLRSVVCYKGYLTPAIDGEHVMGASYDRHALQTEIRPRDHADNLEKLHRILPTWFSDTDLDSLAGRAALRSTTPDRLPMLGPVPDVDRYPTHYADLWKGRRSRHYPPAPCLPDAYVSVGHSSRGLIGAPLAAELIASEIFAEALPLERELLDAVHPARFIVRALKQRTRGT